MIRFLAILLLSCACVRGAAPYHLCLTTNDLIAIEITAKNSRMSAILTGLSTTNSDWGLFLYQTNSAAAVDWLNVFKPANQNGRWIRATVFDVSLGYRIAGGATSGQFLRGNGTEFASASIQTSDLGSGTPDGTKFLRDDRVFAVPPGGGTPANLSVGTGVSISAGTGTGATLQAVTLALSAGSITSLGLADTAVQPARQIISGGGLTGGGTLAADRTLAVGAGNGITVNADDVAVNLAYGFFWTAEHHWKGASENAAVILSYVDGDAGIRWYMTADGAMRWGPGPAGTDTVFYRSAAAEMRIDDHLVIDGLTASKLVATDSNKRLVSLDVATVASGTYTPTLSNVANLDGSTAFACQYSRVGSVVTVSGKVSVNPTLTVTATQLGISLPVASALTQQEQVGGTAYASAIAAQGAAIRGDATNDRAEMVWMSTDTTDQPMHFSFTYLIQ